ncbi:MAG: hypothetical protein NC925_01375 [Candidatus Omnitrophica bacterium]|nr:hypothetical protein [Candidatus Omnitrophota bacterium]
MIIDFYIERVHSRRKFQDRTLGFKELGEKIRFKIFEVIAHFKHCLFCAIMYFTV